MAYLFGEWWMRDPTDISRHYSLLYPRADGNDELRRSYCQSRLHANLQVVTAGKLELTRLIASRIYGMMTQTNFIQTRDNL